MEVQTVDVVGQAFRPDQIPAPAGPEAVFIGRSNVGKSSLINRLIGRKNLARVSGTPGKTRGAFFYSLNRGTLVVVDLPGYGFAKAAKGERGTWESLADAILRRPGARLLVQLVDARHPAQRIDEDAAEWFGARTDDRLFVATKADKLSGGKRKESLRALSQSFGSPVVGISSETGDGIRELWKEIESRLAVGSPKKRTSAPRADA